MILDLIAVLVGFAIFWRIVKMSEQLARLQAEVAENSAVIDSAAALIAGLAQTIRDNAGDPAALGALADTLDANSNKLAAAVAANTEAPEAEEIPAEDLEPIEETPAEPTGETGEEQPQG